MSAHLLAIHEASHATVAGLLGVSIEGISINPQAGLCQFGKDALAKFISAANGDIDTALASILTTIAAGATGEAIAQDLDPFSYAQDGLSGGDSDAFWQWHQISQKRQGRQVRGDISSLQGSRASIAAEMLREYWPQVERLGALIEAYGAITGDKFTAEASRLGVPVRNAQKVNELLAEFGIKPASGSREQGAIEDALHLRQLQDRAFREATKLLAEKGIALV